METKPEHLKRLSPMYDDTYYQMLRYFQDHLKKVDGKYSQDPYSFFYPSVGSNFDEGRILFYDQSISRPWNVSFTINQTIERTIVQQAQEVSNAVPQGDVQTSDAGSVAWRVINKIMDNDNFSDDWSRYCAWSNPVKISTSQSGTINQHEYEAQKSFALKLFKRELEELKPSAAIFLSGLDVANDFVGELGLQPNTPNKECIVVSAKVKHTKIIVTRKPQFETSQKCVEEIIQALCQL